MWSESLPSGREEAIETLLDMEPSGSFYRASQILEESVPQALLQRPNLVTKSALVEQAYALGKYEIDQVSKYDAVFGERQASGLSDRLNILPEKQKDRILRHHDKMLAAKRGASKTPVAPSPKLVASLRRVYEDTESSELRSLLQSVMDYSAFATAKEESSKADSVDEAASNIRAFQLESLIASVCHSESESVKLQGLLLSVLSLVTGYDVEGGNGSEAKEEEADPTTPPPLQLGSILSILRPEEDDKNPWALDTDLLSYLGEAAGTYEERIEIQKARLLAKLETPTTKLFNLDTEEIEAGTTTPTEAEIPASTPLADEASQELDIVAAIAEEADLDDEDIEAAASALTAAVFEQIISAATGEGDSSEEGDSSDSGSDHDSDYEELDRNELDNASSSSSSSSASETGEEGPNTHSAGESEEDAAESIDGYDADDGLVLRQALALTLSEPSQALRVDTDNQAPTSGNSLSPGPITPGNETPISNRDSEEPNEQSTESPLPPIPQAPGLYPFSKIFDTNIDSDQVETNSPYFDPSTFNKFATLPAPNVMVHLFRYTLEYIERRKFPKEVPLPRQDAVESSIVGGVGSALFPAKNHLLNTRGSFAETGTNTSFSLQMLVSLFLLVIERRKNAMEKLNLAMAQQRGAAAGAKRDEENDYEREIGNTTSEEGDDPALALALHYLDDETGETKESLEAKGMHRKAAAAAHDAAAVSKALERRTESWKEHVKLFSQCALLSMKCLRVFLQHIVRKWLTERQGLEAVRCHDLLPKSVVTKLVAGLASFQSSEGGISNEALYTEVVSMDLQLYQDSMLLWAEIVPILYPSVALQADALKSCLADFSNITMENAQNFDHQKITSWPLTTLELKYHKLQMLCRRLRVSDLLDQFVPSPACFVPEETDSSNATSANDMEDKPQRVSSLIRLIGSVAGSIGMKGELKCLYFALCHRCHVRILLWDGLYACTDIEAEDPGMSLSAASSDAVKVSSNPSSSLAFDATRCSDSMALLGNGSSSSTGGSSVHQRASKVWGTVLSSTSFAPKTGVHRWAVRLDKCERGHVFVGVATSQGSVRTYVGGDKYGWGMIGTQALWHDRRKIRGDYGATFRTGSTIIVTLDTDAGTLGFSSWKDNASSNTFALDPLVQSLGSPRRQGNQGGTVDDWGVAFEGLPLDSKLYPAVGLYQRDDRVTLLPVESGSNSRDREGALDLSGGLCYYPRTLGLEDDHKDMQSIKQVRKFNEELFGDGIEYAAGILETVLESISGSNDESLCTVLLPSVAAALSLIPPSIPVLSNKCALALSPKLRKCICDLQTARGEHYTPNHLFPNGLEEGKWIIRATGASGSNSDAEEYVVDLHSAVSADGSTIGFEGTGVGTTGKSKNGLVAIVGTVKGSYVQFVEEWTDGGDEGFRSLTADDAASSCVVTARLSLDGKKFEGTYRNVQFGTVGQIAGMLSPRPNAVSTFLLKDAPTETSGSSAIGLSLDRGGSLLCLALGHMATMLSEDAAADFSSPQTMSIDSSTMAYSRELPPKITKCLSIPLLKQCLVRSTPDSLEKPLEDIRLLYGFSDSDLSANNGDEKPPISVEVIESLVSKDSQSDSFVFDDGIREKIEDTDSVIRKSAGGTGSLSILSPLEFDATRKVAIAALIHHSGLSKTLLGYSEHGIPNELQRVWTTALRLVEDGVRAGIANKPDGSSAREMLQRVCDRYRVVGEFLISLERMDSAGRSFDAIAGDVEAMYRLIETEKDLGILKTEFRLSASRSLLRLIAVGDIVEVLQTFTESTNPTALELLLTGAPRLLGRTVNLPFRTADMEVEGNVRGQLRGHYLMNLPALSGTLRSALVSRVHLLWGSLCKILKLYMRRRHQCEQNEKLSIDSSTLSIYSSFAVGMQHYDAEFLVSESDFLEAVALSMDVYREEAMGFESQASSNESKESTVVKLCEISNRELGRSVLRLLVSVSHLLIFQFLNTARGSKQMHGIELCLSTLLTEVRKIIPSIERNQDRVAASNTRKLGESEWKTWIGHVTEGSEPKTPQFSSAIDRRHVGKAGVNFLQQHGIMELQVGQNSSQKSPRHRSGSATKATPSTFDSSGSFGEQLLSHWLHLIVAVSKVHEARDYVSGDVEWMKTLYGLLGLDFAPDKPEREQICLKDRSKILFPSRFRARTARLSLPFVERIEPSLGLVKALFHLAGTTNLMHSKNYHDDERILCREVVSLLRRLHSPRLPEWRRTISTAFADILSLTAKTVEDKSCAMGVLHFLNGGIEGISKGSYVLLKPAAAASLAVEQQSVSGSKSHSGSSGSGSSSSNSVPHHIIGNGTEGIVAGLCREEAGAGIVSSIDMKNGLCEIILLNRDAMSTFGDDDVVESRLDGTAAISQSSSRRHTKQALTVRALRSPLSDIVLAQEVGFLIDDSMSLSRGLIQTLSQALDIFEYNRCDKMQEGDSIKDTNDGIETLTFEAISQELDATVYATMAIKATISILSDRGMMTSFLKEENASTVLSEILKLAYPEEASTETFLKSAHLKFLSALPACEARWVHLMRLFRGLSFRSSTLYDVDDTVWKERTDDYLRCTDQTLLSPVETPSASGAIDGYNTPPDRGSTALEGSSSIGAAQSSSTSESRDRPSRRNIQSDERALSQSTTTSDRTSRSMESRMRGVSQSTASSENSEDDDDSEAAATAAAHLREAAIAQMAELGLPRSWSELALRRTGGTNIEAAVHFCLERGGEMERLLAEERERDRMMQRQSLSGSSGRRRGSRGDSGASGHLLRQLMEMGFPSRWCAESLSATGNNLDEALTWILANGERLSAEDEGMGVSNDDDEEDEEDSQDEDSDEAGDESAIGTQEDKEKESSAGIDPDSDVQEEADDKMKNIKGWSGSVIPLRFISGRSIIDPKTLAISGLPTGGFSSVGTKGVLLTSGKWYYEAILETAGCLQIGWADGSFAGHCHADRGDGCGDGPSSWAYDGWRRYRWHATATEWGCRWKEGDVIGCMVDMDNNIVSFTLNGRAEEIGMGVAFSGSGFRPVGGVYACVSFNRREKLRLILGGSASEDFKYSPRSGYVGVGEAVLAAVEEREQLVAKESVLDIDFTDQDTEVTTPLEGNKRFLCDFSDGEHGHELMAWAHRYYGSDASVHLGSGRSKQSSSAQKSTSSSSFPSELTTAECLSKRVKESWARLKVEVDDSSKRKVIAHMERGYIDSALIVRKQTLRETFVLAALFARKLILHILVNLGENFKIDPFLSSDCTTRKSALRFWKLVESSASLRSSGWVGEAGAMAIAAEALGLGISSNEASSSKHSSIDRGGIVSVADLDSGVSIPSPGIVQVLSSVMRTTSQDKSTPLSLSLAASSEASLGSDGGGGVLIFIQKGLESALLQSEDLREVVLANLRRSIRLLSVVEYDGEDSSSADASETDDSSDLGASNEKPPKDNDSGMRDLMKQPDARFASFITGLLLSPRLENTLQKHHDAIKMELFEVWSVGLLSASLPWRMVCALTASGLLNACPQALVKTVKSSQTLCRLYGRLQGTVARRVWAERAASPVCSRYVHALMELVASVKRAVQRHEKELPSEFFMYWRQPTVDAATPLPFRSSVTQSSDSSWGVREGWLSSDAGGDVWMGRVCIAAVTWKTPSPSAVRTLMDGGDGPPFLGEGCTVMRGLDWAQGGYANEDGKDVYETEKERKDLEKKVAEEQDQVDVAVDTSGAHDSAEDKDSIDSPNPEGASVGASNEKDEETASKKKKRKKKKTPSPKLPLGTILSIEPWAGIPGMARRVRWHRTGEEGVYRYGGDGGRFDLTHVEVNEKSTRVRKRYPLPESAEQCAARHGFGVKKEYSVMLRLHHTSVSTQTESVKTCEGIMEWPDFGAGIHVNCRFNIDGSLILKEKQLLYGSKDSGWEARFGQPMFVSGTEIEMKIKRKVDKAVQAEFDVKSPYLSMYDELVGSTTFNVPTLRNKEDGGKLTIASEVHLLRGRQPEKGKPLSHGQLKPQTSFLPPLRFDHDYHAPSLSLSRDGRTVSCVSSDGRATAFASMGFTKGVHYWEVKLEQADIGSVFIGVAEKPTGAGSGSSFGFDSAPRLNSWHGWGFVNFRATYTAGAERIYGAHCHAGDTVGVLLDCDAGRISFFFDGLKYGEHILNDLNCAFENISPFGFNVDGCGSGGAGQGAPNGIDGGRSGRYPAQGAVRPKALWPVIGLRNHGDRVTFSSKWNTSYGVDGLTTLQNALAVEEVLETYISKMPQEHSKMPDWFVQEALTEYRRWKAGTWCRSDSRGSGPFSSASAGLGLELDTSPLACASASALLGLRCALLAGDRVRLKRSAGRILELAEEAYVLGAHQGRLYYRIVSQKSEGGSLTEGGGRAWCWDESEVIDGLEILGEPRGLNIDLPLMDRFRCIAPGGLKVVYEGGAVIRSDLEIFDGSTSLGSIPVGTIIPKTDVKERRVNSCGVVRYRILFDSMEGWISGRIRGGKEEAIISPVLENDTDISEETDASFPTPMDSALAWYEKFKTESGKTFPRDSKEENVVDEQTFIALVERGVIEGMNSAESDAFLVSAVGKISDLCPGGNPLDTSFDEIASAISFALLSRGEPHPHLTAGSAGVNQAAALAFSSRLGPLPALGAILARVAMLRALNRRARRALPWLPLRPCQEGSAIFGGLVGHGASVERAGRCNALSIQSWVQVPSIASKLRNLRGLFFASTKRDLVNSITDATTTPTPLSHDEYELPREIRTVRLNRLKARRVMSGGDVSSKRKHSVFAQLHNETKNWGGAALRRGFVAKGHGGQKRAFKVKLIGEGVNDYSGPYREAFTDALAEILNTGSDGSGSLGVLDPTPNNAASIGDNRDLFMFSLNGRDISSFLSSTTLASSEERRILQSFSSLILPRDESSREVEEMLVFLGRITGTAFRHGIPLDLPLPLALVWKSIVEERIERVEVLSELDSLATKQAPTNCHTQNMLLWQQRMLNSFVEGLSNVLPVEILSILSGKELRDAVCGNPEVDVELLRRVVEYEGYEESDEVIQFFWETLREFTNDQRKTFLQFVWARNRLPMKESDFDAPFKIQKDAGAKNGEEALPSASTCFFSLTLPEYSSKEQLQEKLLFAIENVTTMETDFQTNSAEIAEGYRAF